MGSILDLFNLSSGVWGKMKDRIEEIEEREKAERNGQWVVADYQDGTLVGKNWELAHFGECGHHNKKIVLTTWNQHASESNGACPCEDAEFCAHAKNDVRYLLSEVKRLRERVRELEAGRK